MTIPALRLPGGGIGTMRATCAADGETILEAVGLARSFGGVVALEDYSIRLGPGDLVGLIGPNGAGKTTVFNLLTGVLKPTAGTIRVRGRDLTGSRSSVMAF